MSEGTQFKFNDRVKEKLEVEHVSHNPIYKETNVQVKIDKFQSKREKLKAVIENLIQDLDPEDVKECGTPPEVDHIMQDYYSTENSSFFSTSIEAILSFEIKEVEIIAKNLHPSIFTSEISIPDTIAKSEDLIELKQQVTKDQKELNISCKQSTRYIQCWRSS